MEHADEALELDDEGYPILPDNVLDLHLRKKKLIMRQFVDLV